MKNLSLFILSLVFIQCSFAQSNPNTTPKYQIVIESLPDSSGKAFEINFALENIGTYSFTLSESLILPEGYQAIVLDKISGNTFNLDPLQHHSFSVSSATTKQFVVCLRKRKPVLNG